MSGKKSAVGSTEQWEMDLPLEGAGSKRKRERRASGGGAARPAPGGEMRRVIKELGKELGKKIEAGQEAMEDAIRVHVDRGTTELGGAMKTMLESVEKLARDWNAALSAVPAADTEEVVEGQDGKSGKRTKTESRAAALKKVIDEFAGRVRTLHEDVGRAREAQRKSVAVAAVVCTLLAAPLLFGIGLVVQQELGVLPEPERVVEREPDVEWRNYVWERYGQEIIECERQAVGSGREVACDLRMFP